MQTSYCNAVRVKKYGDGNYKITILKNHRVGKKSKEKLCFEEARRALRKAEGLDHEDVDKRKLAQSISRTKTMVLEKALCNDWTWFATLTLDPKKYKRDDLDLFISHLSQFVRDERKRTGIKIAYLLIPELHKDLKNWHMHGLFSELPSQDLAPHYIPDALEKGYLDWPRYSKKFGICTLDPVRDNVRAALYVTKYISKSLDKERGVTQLHKKMYYCSQGLKKAEIISEGVQQMPLDFKMAFEGLYSKSTFVDSWEWFRQYYEELELKEVESN